MHLGVRKKDIDHNDSRALFERSDNQQNHCSKSTVAVIPPLAVLMPKNGPNAQGSMRHGA